jgi:PAS domain S-box-containing protein
MPQYQYVMKLFPSPRGRERTGEAVRKGLSLFSLNIGSRLHLGAAVLGILLFGAFFTFWSVRREDRQMREDLLQQTRLLSQTIPIDQLKVLYGNTSDEQKPEYRRLKAQLMAAVQINPSWKWIYLMDRRKNGVVYFQVDSEAYDAPDPSPPGQTYEEASPVLQGVFDTRISATEGPIPDRWGTWVSAFVPMVDPKSGRLATVVGIDIDAGTWRGHAARAGAVPVLFTLSLLTLLLSAYWLRGRKVDAGGRIRRRWRHLEGTVAMLAGLVLTLTTVWLARLIEVRHLKEAFASQANIKTGRILEAFLTLRNSELEGLARFIEGSEEVTANEFRGYARHLIRVPEVLAWAWVPLVKEEHRGAFEQQVRDAGWQGPDYRIWDADPAGEPVPAAAREIHYPIYFVNTSESLLQYGITPGRDLGAIDSIRTTLEEAVKTGLMSATDVLPPLPGAAGRRTQILVFRPIYGPGTHRSFQGFAMAAVDPEIFLKAFLGENPEENRQVSLDLLELRGGKPPEPIASIAARDDVQAIPSPLTGPWTLTRPVLAFGKTYAVATRPTAEFMAYHSFYLGWIALLAGLSITFASAIVIGFIAHRREDMERLVDERTLDLAASMRSYDLLARHSRTITWIHDANGLYTDISPVVTDVLGYSPEELIGKMHFYDLHPEEGREAYKAMSLQLAAGRQPFLELVNPLVSKSGEIVWMSSTGMPILDADGNLRGYQGTAADITARKRAEDETARLAEENRASAERYATLISASNTGAWEYHDDTSEVWASPEYFAMLGLAPSDFLSGGALPNIEQVWIERLHPDDREQALGIFIRYLKNPEGMYEHTFRMRHVDGRWVWILSRAQVIRDANGRPTRVVVGTHIDISESKRIEAALRESEQKYRTLFEEMLEGFALHEIICDEAGRPADYRYLAANPAFERLTGLKTANLIGKTILEVQPDIERKWIEIFGKVALTGVPVFFDSPSAALGRHYEVTAFRPAPGQFACIFSDVTERKRAEAELQESRRRYAALLANLPGMAYRCANDRDWTMEFVSEGCRDLTGYAPEDFVANKTLSFNDVIRPSYREYLWDKWQALLREHRTFEEEYEITTRTGEIKWVWEQGEGVFDENGRVVALEGFISDITARKRAEAERERLIRAVEQSGEAIMITDADGDILYVNPAFTKITGYSREEAIGQNPRFLQSGRHDAAFYRDMWSTLLAGRTWEGQLVNRRKNGSLYSEQASISPVRDLAGNIVHFVAAKRDISGEMREREEKETLQVQLVQAQKMESIGRLAGGVAHDFNNMLQAILGYAEMALEQVEVGLPLHSDLREIQKAARRSATLTRQLQAFARKQAVAPKVLDINETVESMSSMLRRLIGEEIDLIWRPGPSAGLVRIDPGQLDQLVTNLCINSRDAIGKSGRIVIDTRRAELDQAIRGEHGDLSPGSYVVLSVADDGCGMPPDVLSHIFEPFFTTKQPGQGTGLGLATVYGIVKQNRGGIQVRSAPGKGSTFQIFLPRHSGETPPEQADESLAPASRGDETILLVEDEQTILHAAGRMLESLGYQVLATSSPREALRLAEERKDRIRLVLTDVIMPEMNGPDLVRQLLERHPDLVCLYMSGYTANLIAEQGVRDDGVNFIAKPFSRNGLARKVRDALDGA